MSKKKYIPPLVLTETLEVDIDYALSCGSVINAATISCMQTNAFNEYEDLLAWGMSPEASMDSISQFAFNNDRECQSSCYQAPYNNFFNS